MQSQNAENVIPKKAGQRSPSAKAVSKDRSLWAIGLAVVVLIVLMVIPRFADLNQYIIVDESDRWLWAEDFVYALHRRDLAGTLIGHGYPGVLPAWVESAWIYLEALRRSMVEGQWIGEPGLYLLFHEWSRTAFLAQQRLPIVFLNTGLALATVWAIWRLFGRRVALVSGVLIALDPFYLSDSRINRAEAVITGLMTLSVLAMIFYYRRPRWRYVILSGFLGGLSLLTKIQALIILPVVAVTGFLIYKDDLKQVWTLSGQGKRQTGSMTRLLHLKGVVWFGVVWALAAGLTWTIVWPAMWVMPGETLAQVYDYATHMSGAGGAHVFFLGRTFEDADPGLLFYPLVFLLRITPLTLVGLIGLSIAWFTTRGRQTSGQASLPTPDQVTTGPQGVDSRGIVILLIYIVVYVLSISVGSHKQDRYLMPVFPSFNILAAMGLVYLVAQLPRLKNWVRQYLGPMLGVDPGLGDDQSRPLFSLASPPQKFAVVDWILLATVVLIQIATIFPHHPYYFSYFNPLFGGGQTAARTLRIGWGEGMDQVGQYLAAKPNSRELVVSSRFAQYMPEFKGDVISLSRDGRWTQADYIVLYIQQVQRNEEPSPTFFDYFQTLTPEKVITVGDIDYAWVYARPFTTPANPKVSLIPGRAALFGYRWAAEPNRDSDEAAVKTTPSLQVVWENLGLGQDEVLVARLVSPESESDWAVCRPASGFAGQAQTPGAYVESDCPLALAPLSPGLYTVELGLAADTSTNVETAIESFIFPEGRQAVQVLAEGQIRDVSGLERFDAMVQATIPPAAQRLDRVYDKRLRLAAYRLEPAQPQPGDALEVTLYWQPLKDVTRFVRSSNADSWRTDYYEQDRQRSKPIRLTVQLADSRSISLGRVDLDLDTKDWLVGEVVTTRHRFELAPDLDSPLAAQVEVTLLNELDVPVSATTVTGEPLPPRLARFTLVPAQWPDLTDPTHLSTLQQEAATWQGDITLAGYTVSPDYAQPGQPLNVSLYWQTGQSIAENYVVFVHLLDETGQIQAQSDALPRLGAYPTPWWQPGQIVEDRHAVALPPDLPSGVYRWVVGFYRPEDGVRLNLKDGQDSLTLGDVVCCQR